ncbi:uncharacterized protein LOC108030007 [Drosophila biarmipes]|uniref:uncharacterized protein LOC108030007 n=1 Tax=Drosophila biarmipes TaxID=125945 RepID=UPI0007E6607C|nr:uncharacterized protein LOC108030007 [Drosophila biarmipes]
MRSALLVFLGSCFIWQMTEPQLVYKLTKVECRGNQTRVTNISCHVKPINWNMAVINLDCSLNMPVLNPVVRIQLFQKDYSNQYKPFLVDVDIKLCEVIGRRNFLPYGVIAWKLLKRFTNVNHSCPFLGQIRFRDGYLDTNLIPPLPQGFYQLSIIIVDLNSTNGAYVGTIKYYAQAMEKIRSKKVPRANLE